jgi:hypothetical protein
MVHRIREVDWSSGCTVAAVSADKSLVSCIARGGEPSFATLVLDDEHATLKRQADALLASVLVFEAATLAAQVNARHALAALDYLAAVAPSSIR